MTVTTPPCTRCKKRSTIEVDDDGYALWATGTYVQNAFPDMSSDDRELLITGTHPECWAEMFGGDEW